MSPRPATYPSHRNPEHPQPEVCDVCATLMGGETMIVEDEITGLGGRVVCPLHGWRGNLGGKDLERLSPGLPHFIGEKEIYPPGDEEWSHVYDLSKVSSLVLSFDASRRVIEGAGGVNTLEALDGTTITGTQTTDTLKPALIREAKNGRHALEPETPAGGSRPTALFALSSQVDLDDFYFVAAFRPGTQKGALIADNDGDNNISFSGAYKAQVKIDSNAATVGSTALTAGSDYLLEIWRSGASLTCFLNGSDDTDGTPSLAGTMLLDKVLHGTLSGYFSGRLYQLACASALPNAATRGFIRAHLNNLWSIY